MRTITTLCTLLSSLALVALSPACVVSVNENTGGTGGTGGSSGTAGNTGTGGTGGSNAACYEPTVASGTDSYDATFDAKEHSFSFTVPEDAGGGYVEVKGIGEAVFLGVQVANDTTNTPPGASTGQDGVASIRFVVAPGVTYTVHLEETGVGMDDPPQKVTFEWAFTSVVDCYEPNDTFDKAKAIDLDEKVSAFMLAGYTSGDWPSYEAHEDWYKVTLDKPGKLRATLSTPIALDLSIYAADGATKLEGALVLETEPGSVEAEVEAGTYYIYVGLFASLIYNTFDSGGETPKNCVTPYELITTKQ